MAAEPAGPRRRGAWLLAAIALATGVAATGWWFQRGELQRLREHQLGQLHAIAELKAQWIADWRAELLTQARRAARGPYLIDHVGQLVDGQASADERDRLRQRLRLELEAYQYSQVLLLDLDGRVLLAVPDSVEVPDSATLQAAAAATKSRQAQLSSLYSMAAGPVVLDAVAPVLDIRGEPLASLVLRTDASTELYPHIQSWPVPSRTAESLILRREADAVLFLNELRHQPHTAMLLSLPLTRDELPAVRAVKGHRGPVEGRDYRGVPVIADVQPIADSPWFLVAKVDSAEAFGEVRRRAVLLAVLVGALELLTLALLGLVYRQRHAGVLQAMLESERAQRLAQHNLRTTLYSIGDGVIATDREGRVQIMNPVAEGLTGWREAEARDRSLDQVFSILNERTRAPVENPVARVLREGQVVGLANHTLLVARDGVERPIADSGAPVRDADGALVGVVLVFRDQSEELALQRALRASLERQQNLLAAVPDIVMEVDSRKVYTWANPAGLAFFGDDVVGREAADYFEGAQDTYDRVAPLFAGDDQTYYLESWQRRRDGEKRLLAWWCRSLRDETGQVVGALSTARDVTDRWRAEDARARIAADWQATFDASRDAIWMLDPDGVILRSNQTAERIFGRPDAEMLGAHCWEIVHADRRPHPECPLVRARQSLRRESMELRVGERWFEVTVDPVLDELGAIDRVVHVVSDITERRRSRELMALRLRLHEFAATHSLHGLLVQTLDEVERLTDSQVGFYHFVEPDQRSLALQAWSTRTVRDYCRAEGEGMHYGLDEAGVWADCVRQRQTVVHNDYASLPSKKGLPEGHAPLLRELVVPIFDGVDIVAVLGVGNKPTDYSEQDVEAVTYLAHIAWEIANRKLADEALRESTELLSLFVKNSPIYAFIKEVTASESRVLVASENYVDMIGVTGSQMAGKTMFELFPAEFAAKISADDWAVVSRGEVLHLDEELGGRSYTTIKFPIVREGKRLLAGYTIDVTERRRAEQERRDLQASLAQNDRLASMGMLAAGVAHEINNPLSYVLYNAETLAEDLPRVAAAARQASAALRERVGDAAYLALLGDKAELLNSGALDDAVQRARDALDGTHRIKSIARGLATFSRVERVEQSRLDLKFAIESAAAMARNEIKFRARLVLDLREVPSVLASEGKLAQVFLNLLINAAHAITEGDVERNQITIRTWAEGEWVCSEVADTGAGIPPDKLPHIFEPFFSTKGAGQGSGLGLAICKNIVTEFGGSIQVDSAPGQGTRFVVRLPVARDRAETPTRAASAAPQAATGTRGRILVVDDEPAIRKTLQRLLAPQHEVLCASSGVEAQALLRRDAAFDVILCDLMMPEMTGMDLHAWLLGHDPALAARMVFVTGGAFTPKASEYLARAGRLKVEKPFDATSLRRLVATLVEAVRSTGQSDPPGAA